MANKVRSYTDDQLLDRVKSHARGFTHIPKNQYWVIGVRSNEDDYNKFDDKFYVFFEERFVMVMGGTTNAGSQGLKAFHKYNKKGVAVLQSDRIVYDHYRRGLHKGKVMAYRQDKPFSYYRDNNYDEKNDEVGKVYENIIYANFHPSSYVVGQDVDKTIIGGWSLACQVPNNRKKYDNFMLRTKDQKLLTYCLLLEWNPKKL